HRNEEQALSNGEREEGRLIALQLDRVGNRKYGQRRPGAESHRREARGQSTPIGEPLERVADASPVHRTRADATDDRTEIEDGQRVRDGVDHPRQRDENPGGYAHEARSDSIDEIPLDRHEPRLDQYED